MRRTDAAYREIGCSVSTVYALLTGEDCRVGDVDPSDVCSVLIRSRSPPWQIPGLDRWYRRSTVHAPRSARRRDRPGDHLQLDGLERAVAMFGYPINRDVAQVLLYHQSPLGVRLVVTAVRFQVTCPGPAQHVLRRMARKEVVLDVRLVDRGQIEPVGDLLGTVRGGVHGPRQDLPSHRLRIRGEQSPALLELRIYPRVDLTAVTLRHSIRRSDVEKYQ